MATKNKTTPWAGDHVTAAGREHAVPQFATEALTDGQAQKAAMVELLQEAQQRGLHGLMILSPVDPDDGKLHRMVMISDLDDAVTENVLWDILDSSTPREEIDLGRRQ